MTVTMLYRFHDATGALLYVGITGRWSSRMAEHAQEKPWFADVAYVGLEHFSTWQDARAAELAAIRTEGPRYNIADVPTSRRPTSIGAARPKVRRPIMVPAADLEAVRSEARRASHLAKIAEIRCRSWEQSYESLRASFDVVCQARYSLDMARRSLPPVAADDVRSDIQPVRTVRKAIASLWSVR